jgi:hypothetical protein
MNSTQLINIKNTREWVKANETASSHKYRSAFVEKYGGRFIKTGLAWKWDEKPEETEQTPTKLWMFTNSTGASFLVQNFMEFCRIHDLSKSAMYELMNGKRKSHKGFIKVEKLI